MPLTDYFISDDAAARTVDDSIPPGHPDRIDLKGIQHVELSQLDCMLTGRAWKVEMIDEYEVVFQKSDDGPWVSRVPLALVTKLADLQGPQLEDAARHWASIEEFEGWDPSEVRESLIELVNMARRSKATGKSLFMWICL
jgi:hypothetical protein